jgi:hypothetical protein
VILGFYAFLLPLWGQGIGGHFAANVIFYHMPLEKCRDDA